MRAISARTRAAVSAGALVGPACRRLSATRSPSILPRPIPDDLPAGRRRHVHGRQLQRRRVAGNELHGQRRLGDGAGRPGRQRRRAGHDHEQHVLDQPLRRLCVLQPAGAALHRRLLPQHDQHRRARRSGPRRPPTWSTPAARPSRSRRSAGPAAAMATAAPSRFRRARSWAAARRSAASTATNGPRAATRFPTRTRAIVAAGTYTGRVTYTLSAP